MTHSEGNILLFSFFTSLTHGVNLPINFPTLETSPDSHGVMSGEQHQAHDLFCGVGMGSPWSGKCPWDTLGRKEKDRGGFSSHSLNPVLK